MYRIINKFYRVLCRVTKVGDTCISFSCEGEDLIIDKLFGNQSTGYYIDIGAYLPIRGSNTFKFYLKGWKGVLIEPNPRFNFWASIIRRRDKILSLGIDPNLKEESAEKKMYMYNDCSSNNTISEETVKNNLEIFGRKHDLENIFKFVGVEYLINNTEIFNNEIDIMNIDVEGVEEGLINSIVNVNKITPKVICIEQIHFSCEQIMKTNIYRILLNNDYILLAKTVLCAIYIKKQFLEMSQSDYLKILNDDYKKSLLSRK
jgi:hypothetical protein